MGLDTILVEIGQIQVANTIVLRRLHTKLKKPIGFLPKVTELLS